MERQQKIQGFSFPRAYNLKLHMFILRHNSGTLYFHAEEVTKMSFLLTLQIMLQSNKII